MTRPIMERRVAAAQATLKRFKDRPLRFGREDCGRMCAYHLRHIGRPIKTAKAGTYHSLLGAKKALKKLGYENLIELMDDHFPRIPPAAALVGDVVALPGEGDLGALTVVVGNGRVVGFHPDAPGAAVLQPIQYEAAWRILDAGKAAA